MPLKRRDVESSLESKGFVREERDHAFFIYYTKNGLKSSVRTKVSHGTSHTDISDNLVGMMARQCKLVTKDFKDLIACPLSRDEYEDKLISQGLVESF